MNAEELNVLLNLWNSAVRVPIGLYGGSALKLQDRLVFEGFLMNAASEYGYGDLDDALERHTENSVTLRDASRAELRKTQALGEIDDIPIVLIQKSRQIREGLFVLFDAIDRLKAKAETVAATIGIVHDDGREFRRLNLCTGDLSIHVEAVIDGERYGFRELTPKFPLDLIGV